MEPKNEQNHLEELAAILSAVGAAGIWRPVVDHRGRRLAGGVGDPADGLADSLPGALFRGKRVVDIGCNFGAFTFLAAEKGARHVLGVDIDRRIIRGCRILKALLGAENVDFVAADLRSLGDTQPFDMGMMIDFIGKEVIRSGFLPACLDVIEALSRRQMLFSVRPVYSIVKHFDGSRKKLLDLYPAGTVESRQFLLLDYLEKRFQTRWQMRVISTVGKDFDTRKQTILFERRYR
jgi:ribosomal protein L11 methyltransferase